jgi:ribosomal protein L44E
MENDRTEISLKCPNCEEKHGHIVYEPAPVDTFGTTCPDCSEFSKHEVTGRIDSHS